MRQMNNSNGDSNSNRLNSIARTILDDISSVLTTHTLLTLLDSPTPSLPLTHTPGKSGYVTYLNGNRGGNENLFLSPTTSSFLPSNSTGYRTEEEIELVHTLHSTQSSFLTFFESYLSLLEKYNEKLNEKINGNLDEKYSGQRPISLDVFSCSLALSRVLSNEFYSSQHRALAGRCLERLVVLTGGEVST